MWRGGGLETGLRSPKRKINRIYSENRQPKRYYCNLTGFEEGRHHSHRGGHAGRDAARPRRPLQPRHLRFQRGYRGVSCARVRKALVLQSVETKRDSDTIFLEEKRSGIGR